MTQIPKQIESFNFVLDNGKKPLEKAWQKKIHRIDCPIFQEHINKGKNYGVQSNDSFVNINGENKFLVQIDFDKKDFQEKVIKSFPETFTTTSGSPKECVHLWFASDNNKAFKIKNEKLESLADLIGAGNQVIGPGSRHTSGSTYSVVKDLPIAFMPYAEIEAILKPHDKTPKKIKKPKKQYVPKGIGLNIAEEIINSISMENVLEEIGIDTSKNPTNCFAHDSVGGQCLGFNAETAHCFHCDNSWNKFSLIREAKNLTDKDTFDWFAEKAGKTEELKKSRKEYGKKQTESFDKKEYTSSKNSYTFIKYGKFGPYVDIDAVVAAIRDEYDFKTIYGKTHEEIWMYDGGIWKPDGRELIETYSETLLDSYAKTKVVNEIVKKIKRQTSISREEFDKIPDELIPLQNGVLNFKTNVFSKYSPDYYFKTKLTSEYNKNINCPKFIGFVEEVFYPDDIPVIQEWMGFSLYRRYFIKKGLILTGPQDTSKTLWLSILIKFIGTSNTSGINLQRITNEDKFALASLYNKYVNAYDDLSSKDINNGGGFKMSTGGGYITAEVKFGDPFQFIPFAKQTFTCNKIPPIKDTDDLVYYDRFMPIECDNVVEDERKDPFLIDKLTTKEELSGVLNWALEGLNRLLKNGKFSYNKSSEEVKRIMDRSGNHLAGFVQDCLVEKEGIKITKDQMYELYSLWIRQNKLTRKSKSQLGRDLPRYCSSITTGRGDTRYWEGVNINMNNFKITDTLDAFQKIYICEGNIYRGVDMISKKASFKTDNKNDTLDAFNKKEQEIDFSQSGIREVLEK